MLTIKEICDDIPSIHRSKSARPITAGLVIRHAPLKEGVFDLTPEQALGVRVDRLRLNGTVEGYQRGVRLAHARRMAASMQEGKFFPTVQLALDGSALYVSDGQHRLVAAVLAGKPIRCEIRAMSKERQAQLFADQSRGIRVSADNIALTRSDAIGVYLANALEAQERGESHPWAGILGIQTTHSVIGPALAYGILARWTLDLLGSTTSPGSGNLPPPAVIGKRFRRQDADLLAEILRAFGEKRLNPIPWKPPVLKALTALAVLVRRQHGGKLDWVERFARHMPTAEFAQLAVVTHSESQWREALIRHWNRRLPRQSKLLVSE